jgi:competence protein ComGC
MVRVRKKIKKEENGVTLSMVLIMIFSLSLVLLLTLPNIYLDNQIYKESREIARQQRIVETLKEEQVIIKNRLESIRYKEALLQSDREGSE